MSHNTYQTRVTNPTGRVNPPSEADEPELTAEEWAEVEKRRRLVEFAKERKARK